MVRFCNAWFTRVGLLLVTLGWVVACQPSPLPNAAVTADCTRVEHPAGTTCVPDEMQRLVTLDGVSFEYAIALGLDPIATVRSELQTSLSALLTDAVDVGTTGEPNLEKILDLKPDLIVGLDFYQDIYPQLTQMAPTLLVNFEHSGQWQDTFLQMGAALNRSAAAQQTMAAYEARAADFQAQMGARLEDLQVSVVRIYPDTISLYLRDSFAGTVLEDAGLSRPPSQDIAAEEAENRFGNPIQTSISRELLTQADGDVIFVWSGENTAAAAQQAATQLQAVQADPLWRQLQAVQAGRVYQVPSYWIGSGPIAANAILDDLFKYLGQEA